MIRVGDLQSTPAEWTVKSLVSGRQGPKQAAPEEPVPPPIQNGTAVTPKRKVGFNP